MKSKNPNLIINVTVICSIVLAAALWYLSQPNVSQIQWFVPPPDLSLAPNETIPDSIPYSKSIIFKDSIETIRYLKNGEAGMPTGASFANVIGTSFGLQCDTCNVKWYNAHIFSNNKYRQSYIDLVGWKIKDAEIDYVTGNFVQFYVKNNQSYIHIRNNDTDIPVKFRYNHKGDFLMIPVKESTKAIFNILLTIAMIALSLYVLYLIACFINFLIDISKGFVFTDGNLRRLLLIAISSIAFPIITLLSNLLIKLVFFDYFTKDVVLNINIFKDRWENIAEGAVFLLIYKAFRQGKLLKEEQDLTI